MRTIGRRRRSAASASRARVISFSFARNASRAASHSACDTTFGNASRSIFTVAMELSSPAVFEAWIPIGLAAFGRGVEHGPQRHEIGRPARILAGIGGFEAHLAAPEVTNRAVASREYMERRRVVPLRRVGVIVLAVFEAEVRVQLQIAPAALFLERDQLFDRRLRDDRERH